MTTRYHPVLVTLHWIVALMIFMALVVGGPMLAEMDNADPEKLTGMAGHMIWGMTVGVLIILRLITRFVTNKPRKADAGNAALNTLAGLAHWALYLLIAAMVVSGLIMAINADLFAIAFGDSGQALPANLMIFPARAAHGMIATLLSALILLHIGGWAFHQFILKDRLFSRMWFGKRKVTSETEETPQALKA